MIDSRRGNPGILGKIFRKSFRVGLFKPQIQFPVSDQVKFLNDGIEIRSLGDDLYLSESTRHLPQQFHVVADDLPDPWTQNLNHHRLAGNRLRPVDLRQRCGANWNRRYGGKYLPHRTPQIGLDLRDDDRALHGGDLVAKRFKLAGNLHGQ